MKESFRAAGQGIACALRDERNLRIHLSVVGLVVLFAILGEVPPWGWVGLLLCIGLVIGAELLNSAIERACNRITREKDDNIRDAKDMAAGGVLFCAIIAAAVGLFIFLQPEVISHVLSALSSHPWLAAPLAVYICVVLFWILKGKKGKKK